MSVLNASGLYKTYSGVTALENFSLQLNKGEAYGILGPNGSGKTTALSIILGLRPQDRGEVSWFDRSPNENQRRYVGSSLESPSFLAGLSGENNLKISADIKGVPYNDITRVMEKTGIEAYRKRAFGKYSMGMKQRLSLAAAMLGDPQVLVLDEPTNGLDPQGMFEIREIILELTQQGKTLLMASHILSEVERICTHTLILNKGKIIHDGSTDRVLVRKPTLEIGAEDLQELFSLIKTYEGVEDVQVNNSVISATISDDFDLASLNEKLVKSGIRPNHLVKKRPSLEQQFIELMQEQQ